MLYDLIYLEDRTEYLKAKSDLIKAFPDATIEDASDFIHDFRLSIRSDSLELEDYWINLLNIELALCSLNFRLLMNKDSVGCNKLIDKWKKLYKGKSV